MLNTERRDQAAHELYRELDQFSGTQGYHRLSPLHGRLVATDGVKYLCEKAECFWLLDAIASWQPKALRDPKLREMQFWTLQVKDDRTAILTVARDAGDVAFHQDIEFTDFPLPDIKIWVGAGGPADTYVAMLPGEY